MTNSQCSPSGVCVHTLVYRSGAKKGGETRDYFLLLERLLFTLERQGPGEKLEGGARRELYECGGESEDN